MDALDKLWISVCYFVEFVEKEGGGWTWKYIGNCQANVTPILVSNTTTYAELCDKVRRVLGVDCMLNDIEMATVVPGMSNVPVPPMKIDCDNSVKWYLSVYREVPLCVTLLTKGVEEYEENDGLRENQEHATIVSHGDSLSEMQTEDGTCGDMNRELNYVQDEGNIGDEIADGNFVDWDGLNIIPNSPRRENLHEKSPMTVAHCPREGVIYNNIENLTADISSIPCGPSSRIPENVDLKVKQLFPTKKALLSKLYLLALKYHFEFKVKKSNKSVYVVVCLEKNCKWRIRAIKMKESVMFQVRTYYSHHTCSMSVRRRDHRHASYSLIGTYIASKFEDARRIYRPRNIINDVREEFGITITYNKAYTAKSFAYGLVRGTPDESYAKLPSYCHVLKEKNPGTLTVIETDDNMRFKYFFMALGQSIRGYQTSMRRVICVDGTFMTCRYRGTLLVATCQDANIQIYPLAWGIVDSENEASWTWFFRNLWKITGDSEDLVIISDRGKSIPHAFKNVYQFAHHVNCIWHLNNNLKVKFPRVDLSSLFRKAAEAYTTTDFEAYMAALCGKKEGIREYLEKDVGGFHFWSRAHFKGVRYNIMTTNNAESVNSALKEARDFPVVGLIEYIRQVLQKWYYERHIEAGKCTTQLTPPMEEKMCLKYNESHGWNAIRISENEFQVVKNMESYIVNLEEYMCTCKQFDLDKFPCQHAIVAARQDGPDGYSLCSPFYTTFCWRQAYSEFIYPLPNEDEWQIPDEVRSRMVLRPLTKRPAGRPPKQRKKSIGEARVLRKCARCLKTGHNRTTCTNALPATKN